MRAKAVPRFRGAFPKIRASHVMFMALTLVVVAAIALAWAGRPRSFTEIATPVCTVNEWRNEIIYPSFGNYYWISNSELLIRTSPNSPSAPLYRQHLPANAQQSHQAGPIRLPAQQDELAGISPDGKWAAFTGEDVNNNEVLTLSALDGSRTKSWRYCASDTQNILFWMPDGRRFVVIGSSAKTPSKGPALARIFTLDHGRPCSFPLPALSGADRNNTDFVGFTSSGNAVFQLGSTGFQSVKIHSGGAVNYPMVSLVEIDLNQRVPGALPRFFSLRAPREMDLGMLSLSPHGDRIFWGGFTLSEPSALNKWLHRWIPAVKAEQRLIETGWISNADGSQMHQLGYYEIPGDLNQPNPRVGKGPPWVLEPRWSPDGKRISVLYNDAIYTVPVD